MVAMRPIGPKPKSGPVAVVSAVAGKPDAELHLPRQLLLTRSRLLFCPAAKYGRRHRHELTCYNRDEIWDIRQHLGEDLHIRVNRRRTRPVELTAAIPF